MRKFVHHLRKSKKTTVRRRKITYFLFFHEKVQHKLAVTDCCQAVRVEEQEKAADKDRTEAPQVKKQQTES